MKLQTGATAPDFTTTAHMQGSSEETWVLSQQIKKKPVLLIFYPGDFTAVCTKQLCDYRDHWDQLKQFNVQIVGVSTDSKQSHQAFAATHRFPFALLDDSNKDISRALEMLSVFGYSQRGLMLIDENQKIQYLYREAVPFLRRSTSEIVDILKNFEKFRANPK